MSRSTECFAQLFSWYTPRASYGKIKYVIDRSIKVYLRKDFRYRDCTPRKYDLEMLRYLVDHGADMGQIDEHHNTLLHLIVLPEEAMILLDATGYFINHKNDFGWTPMMVLITLAASDAPTMLKIIREANSEGATIGSFDNRGKTALHHLLDSFNGTINIKTDSECQKLDRTFTNPIVARTAILKAALLVQLGAEICQGDACSCHCCHNGCSIFRRFLYRSKPWDCRLKRCRSFTEEMHSLPWLVELFTLLKNLGCVNDGHEIAKEVFRMSAFEMLNMTHTCCGDNFARVRRVQRGNCYTKENWESIMRTFDRPSDFAAVEGEMREIEDEERELAIELDRKCDDFSRCVEAHEADTWIGLLAQRIIAREDVARSEIQPWLSPQYASSYLEKLKKESNILILSELARLYMENPHTSPAGFNIFQGQRHDLDSEDPMRVYRIETYLDIFTDNCGHDYEGLAELLPDPNDRKELARERKEVVEKLTKEVQRLRKTPPKERKWPNIFEEVEEQHVDMKFDI
ncbi:hypothetical protein IWX49DRAFT_381858 [Phyllosticta citricarpa]|uniref:Ankyrin repeat protein n=1 Tax=Phyllosticta citricarpa TaxID=55181 RepID=A0ABR1L9Y0_9PEZI